MTDVVQLLAQVTPVAFAAVYAPLFALALLWAEYPRRAR